MSASSPDRAGGALVIRYSRLRTGFAAAVYFALAVFLRLLQPEAGADEQIPPALLLLAAGIVALQGVRLAVIAAGPAGPLLVIGADGLDVRKPLLGRLSWDEVEDVEISGKLARRGRLTFRLQAPHRPFPPDGYIYAPLARALFRDSSALEVSLFLTDTGPGDVARALQRFWPGFEMSGPPRAGR